MNTKKFWSQLIPFVIILVLILVLREYVSHQLIANGIDSYQTHAFISIAANIILILVSYVFISKNGLFKIAGLKDSTLKKAYLLVFPLVYLIALNVYLMDDIDTNALVPNLAILLLYAVSIGFAEELSIRGFLQSHLINHFGKTKKNVVLSIILSALFFGFIHLLNFDKGIYGELSQIGFATFIGLMFGVLLVITKRLYPLIIIHAAIDFVAKLDTAGFPIKEKISTSVSLENAIYITLLAVPCLIYATILMRKHKLKQLKGLHHIIRKA